MTDEEIQRLIRDREEYGLLDVVIERELSLALVNSDDPGYLLKIPEPFRSRIVAFGLTLTDCWQEVSSDGMTDYSEHAPKLHALVSRFQDEVPVGQYIRWLAPTKT
jgi:hypothetical protein